MGFFSEYLYCSGHHSNEIGREGQCMGDAKGSDGSLPAMRRCVCGTRSAVSRQLSVDWKRGVMFERDWCFALVVRWMEVDLVRDCQFMVSLLLWPSPPLSFHTHSLHYGGREENGKGYQVFPPMIPSNCRLVNDGRSSESEKYFQRALSYEPAHKNALLYYKQVLFGAAALWVKEWIRLEFNCVISPKNE